MIKLAAPMRGVPIIDIGAGASRLADDLLIAGYSDLTLPWVDESICAIRSRSSSAWRQREQPCKMASAIWSLADRDDAMSPQRTGDKAGSALKREIGPEPVECDDDAIPESD